MSGQIKTQAIVLNKVDYKDSDRVITLFSPQLGRITATCRGVKKQTAKLLPASEIFAFGTYVLTESKGRYTVTAYDSVDPFHELRSDFDRLSLGVLLLKICERSVSPGEGNMELFSLLINSLHKLRLNDIPIAYTASVFLLKFCVLMGYQPDLDKCVSCGKTDGLTCLAPGLGGITCLNCNNTAHVIITGGCLYYMRKICKESFEQAFLYKPTEKQIKELYRTACYYTAYFFDEKLKIMDYINKYQLV